MPTLSQENYLKALWHLAGDGKVTLQRLAKQLGISPASALAMVRKLAAAKLVTYSRNAGIRLTAAGRRAAIEVVRRHRLWEVFLHDKLGYRWDEVHRIAEELEHIAIPDLADRLDVFLGKPAYDPHGDPIPQKDGSVPPRPEQVLSQQEPGRYRIAGLKSTADELLRQLEYLDLALGQIIELRERLPFDGTLVLRIGRRTQHIGMQIGDQLLVLPA
ncbi:MAG: iron-dependent repressor [Candidatus Kapaibacterium sp.]|nr:MAG: iron-dependent repressor [Candidatus Kapabacteria bacterium]